jgi:hypothetical protein
MSLANFMEAHRRNPEHLSMDERDEREAERVADREGHYITRNGERIYNKKFIEGYKKLIET